MKTKTFSLIIFISGLYLLLNACSKEEENKLPVINIISPVENAVFLEGGIIPLEVIIEDDKLVQSVTVLVVDLSLSPVSNSYYFFPKQQKYSLIENFVLPAEGLPTGYYYLKVRADDEENFKNEFVQIYIEAMPQTLNRFIVLTKPGNDNIQVSEITNFEYVSTLFSFEGDYSASAISSENDLLFISGIEKINIRAYDLDNYDLSWEKPIIPQWSMHNNNCMYFDNLLYVSFDYLDIYGFTFNGLEQLNTKVGEYDSPHMIFRHENFLLCDVQKKNGSDPYLGVYYLATGVEAQRSQTDFEVVGFHSYSTNEVIIVANFLGLGYICKYDIANNLQHPLFNSNEAFYASVNVGSENIYIATDDGISVFSVSNNTLSTVLSESGFFRLDYENIHDLLVAVKSNEVKFYNLPEMTNQKTIPFSDSIINIHIEY